MQYLISIFLLSLNIAIASPVFSESQPLPDDNLSVVDGLVQTVQRFKLADGVSAEDAIDSMKLRANQRNFKLVAELPLSEQVRAMGKPSRYMHILAFCDALTASKMVQHNLMFAAFLPCRIAVVQDAQGEIWLVTMNIDQVLGNIQLPNELQPLAQEVRDTIYSIIDAGVNGDL